MFGCNGISDHACWNEVFHYWETKLSCIVATMPHGYLNLLFPRLLPDHFLDNCLVIANILFPCNNISTILKNDAQKILFDNKDIVIKTMCNRRQLENLLFTINLSRTIVTFF